MSAFTAALDKILCTVGLPAHFQRVNRDRLAVFMYHGVVERALVPFCWHQLPVDAFRRQLGWIRKRYNVLPLETALDKLESGSLPRRSAAITFDDGFLNNKTIAWPVLDSFDLPATIFLVTDALGGDAPLWPDRVYLAFAGSSEASVDLGLLGLGRFDLGAAESKALAIDAALRVLKRTPTASRDALIDELAGALLGRTGGGPSDPGPFRIMSWSDVHEMAADPRITFGAHTLTHPILAQCEAAEDIRHEVGASQAAVTEALGRAPWVFAYPNGRPQDFDDRALAAVEEAQIEFALSTVTGLADVGDDPRALPRICVGSDMSFDRFRLVASGAWKALRG